MIEKKLNIEKFIFGRNISMKDFEKVIKEGIIKVANTDEYLLRLCGFYKELVYPPVSHAFLSSIIINLP
jgi:hypothetical protein